MIYINHYRNAKFSRAFDTKDSVINEAADDCLARPTRDYVGTLMVMADGSTLTEDFSDEILRKARSYSQQAKASI